MDFILCTRIRVWYKNAYTNIKVLNNCLSDIFQPICPVFYIDPSKLIIEYFWQRYVTEAVQQYTLLFNMT